MTYSEMNEMLKKAKESGELGRLFEELHGKPLKK